MYSRLYRVLTNPFGHIFQIDCPGKHCESCGGLGHQESSLRCALEEAMFLQSMSAIDFYCSIDKVKGVDGKDRVALVFDGKYLPHSEQDIRDPEIMVAFPIVGDLQKANFVAWTTTP